MKTIKLLLVLVTFSVGTFANTTPKETPTTDQSLVKEVTQLLDAPNFKISEDLTAQVTFMLNKNNEIIVVSVDSSYKSVEDYVKSRLNYKKVKANPTKKLFKMPFRIKA